MVKYLLITIFILLVSPFNAIGQKQDLEKNPFTIGLKPQYGSIIIHSREVREIKDSNPIGMEVDFSWHKNKQKQWDNCHCYPRVGVLLNYFYYDNPEILGNGFAAAYYIEPFFGAHRKLSISARAGIGVTYLSNPYHSSTNPNNQSYSTRINSFLLLDVGLNYRISDKISINASTGFNHTSNGGIKEPNKGINFPTVGIGIDYTPNPQKFLNRDKTRFKDTKERSQRLELDMLAGLKTSMGDKHLIWGSSANYSRQIGRISALIGSAEFMVNGVVKEEMKRNGIEGKSPMRIGMLFGHEFLMGRYHFSTQMGIYAYRPYRDNGNDLLYQRYKLSYRFDSGIYLGFSVKAHRHVADYFDFRIGYSFKKVTS